VSAPTSRPPPVAAAEFDEEVSAPDEVTQVRIYIEQRLHVGWGAWFGCRIETLRGPPLPQRGAVTTRVATAFYESIAQNDQIVLDVEPGVADDKYRGALHADVGADKLFWRVLRHSP
jgi:hypothetical protein